MTHYPRHPHAVKPMRSYPKPRQWDRDGPSRLVCRRTGDGGTLIERQYPAATAGAYQNGPAIRVREVPTTQSWRDSISWSLKTGRPAYEMPDRSPRKAESSAAKLRRFAREHRERGNLPMSETWLRRSQQQHRSDRLNKRLVRTIWLSLLWLLRRQAWMR